MTLFYPLPMRMKNITQILMIIYSKRTKSSSCTLIPLLLLSLLVYNTLTIFSCTNVPSFPAKPLPEFVIFLPEHATGETTTLLPGLHVSVKEEVSNARAQNPAMLTNRTTVHHVRRKRGQGKRQTRALKILGPSDQDAAKRFEARVKKFFRQSKCELRFFMTWISSVGSFGEREMSSVESLFSAHPDGCLIIVSRSMDSRSGMRILAPLVEEGFKATAIAPDFNYLFEGTGAHAWYRRLKRGDVNPGGISLGQNLSNLLRMGLLYRFGGVYMDTDVIVLKSFSGLRNVIGAQTVDLLTGNWTRLNNAVMIFDKGHRILREFIEEFAKTFDGNKWGHNGPYLVSRVVSRESSDIRCDLTVLPPTAFYPVGWSRIGSLFAGPRSLSHSRWLDGKMRQITSQSFAVHLWNKRSRKLKIEKGSVIQHILFSSSVLRRSNYSSSYRRVKMSF